MEKSKRYDYLDLLRIIACFLVIFNHTDGYANCFKYDGDQLSLGLMANLFIGMLIKIHVPTFFMISGTLLLGKDLEIGAAVKKAVKFFVILTVFSIFANIVYTGHFYAPGFIRTFASADVDGAGPYWYLYAYIGILLISPFLRFIAANLTVMHVKYLIFLRVCITGLIPMAFLILNKVLDSNIHLSNQFNPAIVIADCIFYPLIGFGLDKKIDIKDFSHLKIAVVLATFLGANLLECLLTWYAGLDNVFNGFDFLMTITFFLFIKYILVSSSIPSGLGSFICTVGKLTFGIYLLDPILGTFLKPAFYNMHPAIPSLLAVSLFYSVASFVLGGFITFLWEKTIIKLRNRRS